MFLLQLIKYIFVFSVAYSAYLISILYQPKTVPEELWRKDTARYPTDTADNIFWFVQISDIHVSRYYDPTRLEDLEQFCTETVRIIQPELVLVTGDLTDAKHADFIGSEQYEDEWIAYNKVLTRTRVTEKTVWLDIRGNHDVFNVRNWMSDTNYYKKYSGDKGVRSYTVHNVVKPYGTYSFVPVDATLTPGPRRPYNFLGYLSSIQTANVQKMAESTLTSNLTVYYSHYPTSAITVGSTTSLESIISSTGSLYLCGHFHDWAGFVPRMYAMHRSGYLELELSDWKNNRQVRILAVDHDVISFVDVPLNDWPVVLITLPKPATYMMPKHEAIGRVRNATHIRFLVFTPNPIVEISITIDGKRVEEVPFQVEGPLWACKWDPSLHAAGMHTLEVYVIDTGFLERTSSVVFSLDSSWDHVSIFGGSFALLTDFVSLARLVFLIASVFTVSLFYTLRKHKIHNSGVIYQELPAFVTSYLNGVHSVLADNVTFYLLFGFLINILIGPQFIGHLLDDEAVVVLSFGYYDGEFHDERHLLTSAVFTIVFLFYPFTLYLCYALNNSKKINVSSLKNIFVHLLFLFYLYVNVKCVYELWVAYGQMAALLSPSRLWWILVVLYLSYRTWKRTV